MKNLDILSIGAWAIYDHLFRLASYPRNGDTVTLDMPIEKLDELYFGDCSANIAAVAARLGMKTGLAMVVGDDFITTGYRDHLLALGVDLEAVEIRPGERSGHNYLYFDRSGDGFCISHQGVAADQSDWGVPETQIRNSKCVVLSEKFSTYTLESARLAKQTGAMVVLNGMVASAGDLALEFVKTADILFIAESEIAALLKLLGLDAPSRLHEVGLKTVFATQGKKGSIIYTEGRVEHVPSVLVEDVVDTTGAGDSYTAGTLSALIRGYVPAEAARIGATVSSFIIQAWGCQTRLPTWDEMMDRRNNLNQKDEQ